MYKVNGVVRDKDGNIVQQVCDVNIYAPIDSDQKNYGDLLCSTKSNASTGVWEAYFDFYGDYVLVVISLHSGAAGGGSTQLAGAEFMSPVSMLNVEHDVVEVNIDIDVANGTLGGGATEYSATLNSRNTAGYVTPPYPSDSIVFSMAGPKNSSFYDHSRGKVVGMMYVANAVEGIPAGFKAWMAKPDGTVLLDTVAEIPVSGEDISFYRKICSPWLPLDMSSAEFYNSFLNLQILNGTFGAKIGRLKVMYAVDTNTTPVPAWIDATNVPAFWSLNTGTWDAVNKKIDSDGNAWDMDEHASSYWQYYYRPTKVRITGTGFDGATLNIEDDSNTTLFSGPVISGGEYDLTGYSASDSYLYRAHMNHTGSFSITKLEFFGI